MTRLALFAAMGACAGDTPTESTADTSAPDTTDTVVIDTPDTATDGRALHSAWVTAGFALNGTTGVVQPGTMPDGTVIEPFLQLQWTVEGWDGNPAATDDYCVVRGTISGATLSKEPPFPQPLGIDVPPLTEVTEDCTGRDFTLDRFGGGDVVAGSVPPGTRWTLGFGGPLGPGLAKVLSDKERAEIGELVGGVVITPLVPFGGTPDVFLRAWVADDGGVLADDNGDRVRLDPLDVLDPYTYATASAWYELVIPMPVGEVP